MKKIVSALLVVAIQGCVHDPVKDTPAPVATCVGNTHVSEALSHSFEPVQDDALLTQSIGEPLKGKLCQGKVYKSTTEVTVYRAWNSTNPQSQFGQWWALKKPAGLIANYRKDYEICYQWSPLDKMAKCTLKAGTKVVIGNGQSATCSAYLTYPVSPEQQVFLLDAVDRVGDCQVFDGVMEWR